MLQSVLLPALLGFVWGLAVSLFNNFWTARAIEDPSRKISRFFFAVRQIINLLAMFAVYRNTYVLIGTALGLLAIKNYILFKNIKDMLSQRKQRKG